MVKLVNDPQSFRDQFYDGFLRAYSGRVRAVSGSYGVMAVDEPRDRVSVLIGGGSGHYPTRCGLVGPGLADIAVVGNTFASPSAQQILGCTRAVHAGHGVVYLYGNYAGDMLNFDSAAAAAESEGITIRQVVGCDDVASAPVGKETERRGVAGDFFLFKIAGAAASGGRDLDGVADVAERANRNIRSFGVAFAGCTLPGSSEPLFSVAAGEMEVGLGIHGEPGVRTAPLGPADEVAELVVSSILAAAPAGAEGRVAVLVNSLGSTSREELFVFYRRVEAVLAQAGIDIHHVIVDALTTSLDMAGCSLSLLWLDSELAELYDRPASSPAYTHIVVPRPPPPVGDSESTTSIEEASAATDVVDRDDPVHASLVALLSRIQDTEDDLGRLDAHAGDGDHGRTLVTGLRAAVRAVADQPSPRLPDAIRVAARAFAEAAGGTSGMLVGSLAERVADELVAGRTVAVAMRAGTDQVRALGKAEVGDKTMVDALVPFCDALDDALAGGASLADAWRLAADVATAAAAATAPLVARKGRAAKVGARSAGHPDAGATSTALILSVLWESLSEQRNGHEQRNRREIVDPSPPHQP